MGASVESLNRRQPPRKPASKDALDAQPVAKTGDKSVLDEQFTPRPTYGMVKQRASSPDAET